MKIDGNTLISLGYEPGRVIGIILEVIESDFPGTDARIVLDLLKKVLKNPAGYSDDPRLSPIAFELLKPANDPYLVTLKPDPGKFTIYGVEGIEAGAIRQMETAMKLPVAVAGSLMPDAHPGYGLPIGGVLAAKN